ncbi:MAG: hypothetical protein E6J66_11675, partial [Deltaproteobacteria bacterium]
MTARAIWRRSIERILEAITGALLVVLAVEVLAGIAFRAARRPLAWYDEVASVLLAWQGTSILHALAGETLVTVNIPISLTQSVIPIGAALFVVAELLNLPDRLSWAMGRNVVVSPQQDTAKEL